MRFHYQKKLTYTTKKKDSMLFFFLRDHQIQCFVLI